MPKTVIANPIKMVTTTLTRPTETPAVQYAAGDVLANSLTTPTVLTFEDIADEEGQGGKIVGFVIVDSANQSTKAQLALYFFDTAPAATNDNAAWAPTDAELLRMQARLASGSFVAANPGSGADGNALAYPATAAYQMGYPFKCAAGSKDLYCVPTVLNTYTPLSAESFTFTLMVELH